MPRLIARRASNQVFRGISVLQFCYDLIDHHATVTGMPAILKKRFNILCFAAKEA
jgi:hypothetical protein